MADNNENENGQGRKINLLTTMKIWKFS